ncbi:DNA recombination protein RmuC [Candidatus Spongiihabitans sp.]|uniref:DNA recombination protein RmuC n=1 Tax=Candidatus Spongiihabitans sp. TaxID=3101308 RepID=UPI003C6F3996
MLEAIITITSLVLGIGIGWWVRSKSSAGSSEKISRLEADLQSAREAEVISRTTLKNQQNQFEQEKKRLHEIRKEMENSFKAMAADIANTNSETFLKQANQQFKSLKENSEKDLDEKKKLIDKSLSGMNEKLEFIGKQSTELKSSIDTSQKTTEALSENTARLREILSSSQKRGQWGERMVVDILQFVGLMENVNYTKQSQVESGQRPDFTFILPQEKRLNMDVKFPLAHYENYLAADSEEAQAQEKTAFLRDVKNHIKSVCGHEYINPAEGTLDYVMLFIPNESIYGFINREDTDLVDYALQNHVLLCSPLTLYAVLSLIHQAARNFTMNERASEVMALVDQFRNQWKKYVEQMDKLGRRIKGLSGDFDDLVNTRTRALEKPLDRIKNVSLAGADEISGDTPELLE